VRSLEQAAARDVVGEAKTERRIGAGNDRRLAREADGELPPDPRLAFLIVVRDHRSLLPLIKPPKRNGYNQ
jgi:hypothetical protein